jgi:hypothetical protein
VSLALSGSLEFVLSGSLRLLSGSLRLCV